MKTTVTTKRVQGRPGYPSITVTFSDLTAGKLSSMRHAFEQYAKDSAVGEDIRISLENGVAEAIRGGILTESGEP